MAAGEIIVLLSIGNDGLITWTRSGGEESEQVIGVGGRERVESLDATAAFIA